MSTQEFVDQVAELRRERDLARSERDLMERIYHGSLGTAENCSKLNRALADWQQQSLPAVRAVREILRQRPELRDPDGVVKAVLNGAGKCQGSTEVLAHGQHPTGKGESVCVGEIADQGGGPVLRCGNCGVVVAAMSKEQFQELDSPDPDRLRVLWAMPWAEHVTRKCARLGAVQASARPANPNAGMERSPRCPTCRTIMQFCDDWDQELGKRVQPDWWHCEGCGHNEVIQSEDDAPRRCGAPPVKAEVKQAYPKGRWTR